MIMKLKMFFMLLAAGLLSLNLQSCDDDDDKGIAVSAELQNAFTEKYPNTQVVKWETEGAHYVAEFYNDRYVADAWFTPDGIWQMTETDLPYDALPAAVRSAFQSSQYAQWKVEDVDMVERRAMETVYVIEVESGNQELYSRKGSARYGRWRRQLLAFRPDRCHAYLYRKELSRCQHCRD